MKAKTIYLIFVVILPITLLSCGTSTGSRYENGNGKTAKNEKIKTETKNKASEYPENFNLAPYRAKITITDTTKPKDQSNLNVWYNYHTQPDTGDVNRIVIRTTPGYRVQVLSTDNLDDANKMRSDIYFNTNQKAVYIIFDPPFYKVEVGDFTNLSDARSLTFKFKQMGYTEARVVNQTVNIFQ
jgi:SPOR domain